MAKHIMTFENIVFSGFKNYNIPLSYKYNISNIIDNNTKYVIVKDIKDIDCIESYTKCSHKIKFAIQNKIPIISEKKFNEIKNADFF